MKAKDRLENIQKMDNMIDLRLDNVKEQRNKLYKITTVLKENDVQESSIEKSPLEKSIVRLLAEEEAVNKMIDKFVDHKNEVLDIINSITSDDYRRILYLKYLKYLDLQELCNEMDCSARSIHRLTQKALFEYSNKEIEWYFPELA